jgi:O-6-methylguanine DNA methyltransferase
MSDLARRIVQTPLGPMLAEADVDGLRTLVFADGAERVEAGSSAVLDRLERELAEYFAGSRQRFTVAVRLRGTVFQQRVWAALCEIPHGRTISYAELASRIGNPRACRAVGGANGANPIAIVIPCHRVIAAGGLGGYGGGLWRKRRLLELEGVGELF